MCIFSQPVQSVSQTRIFARAMSDGWQYLVYQMKFQSQTLNAMILPLPIQLPANEDDSLEFISLKQYDDFFTDLDRLFPIVLPTAPATRGAVGAMNDAPINLKVHDVGDFVASFVPTMSDFGRLDPQFRVPAESWEQIPRYSDYGFAVFQLKSLAGKPHPMAFKFKSRLNATGQSSVFFPTVHIHDGQVHDREQFDHRLYLQASEFDEACGRYVERGYSVQDQTTGYVRSKWAAARHCDIQSSEGILNAQGLVHRKDMKGHFANSDVIVDLTQPKKSAGLGPVGMWGTTALAAVAGMTGMKWFFDRRDQVNQQLVSDMNTDQP